MITSTLELRRFTPVAANQFVYGNCTLPESELYHNKVDVVLPLVSLHTLHLGHPQGARVGLMISTQLRRNVVYSPYCLHFHRSSFHDMYPVDVVLCNEDIHVSLDHTVDDLRFYSYLKESVLIVPKSVNNAVTNFLDKT